MECPHCGGKLEGSGEFYRCVLCGRSYDIAFYCENCDSRIRPAAACGGANFFCDRCMDLKSREAMKKEFYRRQ
ncbi:MAG: zinc-ribbon domain-containing protein [Spirochaetia bacterium]